jgi:hypothetical protein
MLWKSPVVVVQVLSTCATEDSSRKAHCDWGMRSEGVDAEVVGANHASAQEHFAVADVEEA